MLQAQWVDGFGDTIPLTRQTVRVGRSLQNDIAVEHPGISGRHLEILCQPGAISVRDLGSTNGTFMDGRRMPVNQALAVPPNATIRLHNCLNLRFLPPDSGLSTALQPKRVRLVRQPQPGLAILQRSGQLQRVPLGEGRTRIGRSPGNDIVIDHPQVSGLHAEVVAQGADRCHIRDVGSRNGLTYQGRRIESTLLQPSDAVWIGDQVMIRFQPNLVFVTQPPPVVEAAPDKTMLDAARLSQCRGCGATNYGPQSACLRCQTPLF